MDTGSDYSFLPWSSKFLTGQKLQTTPLHFHTASGENLPVRGILQVSFFLKHFAKKFTWKFFIADVSLPILGLDFLQFHRLLVDPCLGISSSQQLSVRHISVSFFHGPKFFDRKSTFQAHFAPAMSAARGWELANQLSRQKEFASATHNIVAVFGQENSKTFGDFRDDGEYGAGRKLLHLLQLMNAKNVVVVVSRWYGGVHLGPARFRHINGLAKDLILEHGFAQSKVPVKIPVANSSVHFRKPVQQRVASHVGSSARVQPKPSGSNPWSRGPPVLLRSTPVPVPAPARSPMRVLCPPPAAAPVVRSACGKVRIGNSLYPKRAQNTIVAGVSNLNSNLLLSKPREDTVVSFPPQLLASVPHHLTRQFRSLLGNYERIFRKPDTSLPVKHPVTHHIKTVGPPVFARPRGLLGTKLDAAKAQYFNLLKTGMVFLGESPWAAPLHMVLKASGEWRECGDYRGLNAVTEPDRYPMPTLQGITNALAGSNCYSKLDLTTAFNQIPMALSDQQKTAVTTPFGLFIHRRMPFGLRNASQTFQRLMDTVFYDLKFVHTYIDDVLIASTSPEEHLRHLSLVFKRVDDMGLRLKPVKCLYFRTSVAFLGMHLSPSGVKPAETKIAAIKNFKTPVTVKEVKSFLGLCGFYHRFVPQFSHIAAPLNDLTKAKTSGQKVVWSEAAETAFCKLKQALGRSLTLAFPVPGARLELVTDASSTAAGAALHQVAASGVRQPLVFFSRKFSTRESQKSAFDRELLAMVLVLRSFSWLLGMQFTLVTDHKPLLQIFSMKNPTPQQSRWISFISEFSCQIVYQAGSQNVVADAFSRSVNMVASASNAALSVAQQSDRELATLIRAKSLPLVKTTSPDPLYCLQSHDKLRPFVSVEFRQKLFTQIHNLSHPGPKASANLVAQTYFWPSLDKDVKMWSKCCLFCQSAKVARHTKSPVSTIPTNSRFQTVHVDLVGPLPESNGCKYIFTMIDRFSNWLEAAPIKDATTPVVAAAFIDHWVSRFGVPEIVVSDRGVQFESAFWADMQKCLGIQRKRTTSYHPQANGLVERAHRSLKNALRAKATGISWASDLPLVLLGLRSVVGRLGFSPSQVVFGANLRLPTSFFAPLPPTVLTENTPIFVRQFHRTMSSFAPPVRQHSAPVYVPKALDAANFVWVKDPQPIHTFAPKYRGPFPVVSRSNKTLDLRLPTGVLTKVSIDRCKPAFAFNDSASHQAEANAPQQLPPASPNLPSTSAAARPTLPLQNFGTLVKPGVLVNAKFTGFPLWPAKIIDPSNTPLLQQPHPDSYRPIQFFGSNRLAWLSPTFIFPFEKAKLDLNNNFVAQACKALEDFKTKSQHWSYLVQQTPGGCLKRFSTRFS